MSLDLQTRDAGRWSLALLAALAVALTFYASAGASAASAADGCANAQFRTGASAGLPDCRAYEQVTQREKFGQQTWFVMPAAGAATSGALPGWVSDDGDRVLFSTSVGPVVPDPTRGFGAYPQTVRRTDDGWVPRVIPGQVRPESASRGDLVQHFYLQPNRERTGALFMTGALLVPEQPVGSRTSPSVMFGTAEDTTWVSQPPWEGAFPQPSDQLLVGAGAFAPVGQSDDGSAFFFMTRQVLTPEDVASGRNWADSSWAVYRWKDGVVRNVGVLPPAEGGAVDPAGSMSPGMTFLGKSDSAPRIGDVGRGNFTNTLGITNVVSRDGRRALFLGGGNETNRVAQLYLYREGQPTLLLSKRTDQSGPVTGTDGVMPVGMYSSAASLGHNAAVVAPLLSMGDADLGVVLFSTRDALTDDAPVATTVIKTYRYTVASGDLQYLDELDWSTANASRMLTGNVVRMSDDGSRILFWTPAGQLKLWRDGASTLTLASGLETSGNVSTLGARFSDDARTVVFQSTRAIGGELNHPAGNGPNQTQVYRFDENVDGTTPRCVTCPPLSAAVRAQATLDLFSWYNAGFGARGGSNLTAAESRSISNDGRRIYFTTTSTLDPRDQNTVPDVYEWSADRGTSVLLSGGAATSKGSGFLDVDASGNNAFFVTADVLTASDEDDLTDLYVARVRGGLPDPPPLFKGDGWCAQMGCQGQAGGGPGLPLIGSVGFAGRGNVSLPASASVRVSKLKAVVGSVARLRVRVPGAGRISVAGASIRRAGKPASKAGSYSVRVALSSKARKSLKKKKKLRVGVRISYRSRDGRWASRTVTVTFKQPQKRSIKTKQGGR